MDLNILATIKNITLINMLGSIYIKKFVFIIYLIEDEQELSLGMLIRLQRIYNLWSIHAIILSILDVLWALQCTFILLLGLTYWPRAQWQFLFFPLFQCFEEKEYQTESKGNETFWRSYFWKESYPIDLECTSGKKRGSHEGAGRLPPPGRDPTLVGPLWLPRCPPSTYIYPYTLKT